MCYWPGSFWPVTRAADSCVQGSRIQQRLKKEKRTVKIKALGNTAILQWTPGSPFGGIPLLGTPFSPAKGWELLRVGALPARRRAGRARGLAASALAVYFLGSQTWSSGMSLVFILRKFIFDSGRAGEEVNDRKRREGAEILWGCPHNTTSSPITKAARRWSKAPKSNMPVVLVLGFFFFKAQRWL